MDSSQIDGRMRRARARGVAMCLTTAVLLLACSGTIVASLPGAPPSADPATTPADSGDLQTDPIASATEGPVGATPAGSSPTAPHSGGNLGWIFETPGNTVDLAVGLDADQAVEAVIPAEGGTLSATGTDGTAYTLDIPANALLTETTIGMTPVSSIAGMPFGERALAVQFSPDGLSLLEVAILTITPAEDIPIGEQIPFSYQADGKDVIFATPVIDSAAIDIEIRHFSGSGVTKGILADIEPERRRLGGDAERRLHNAFSEQLIRIRQQGGDLTEVVAAFMDIVTMFEDQVVKPRVAAAGESCAAGRLAIETVLSLERQRQILGDSSGTGLEKYPGLVNTVARVCVIEEFELCVEDHVVHRMAMVWRGYERQFALYELLGVDTDPAVLSEARDLTEACLTFELRFESTGTLDVSDGGYESTVSAVVKLTFSPDQDNISGEAALVNDSFDYRAPCGATSSRGGGTFQVFQLRILSAKPDSFEDRDLDFLLSYLPGQSSESARIKLCGTNGFLPVPPFAAWTSTYLATHASEIEKSGGFISIDWEVFGDEYFAKKEWIKEAGDIVEAGTFKLYHKPGG